MAIRTGTGGFIQFGDTSGASMAGTPAARKMTISRWSLDIPRDEGDVTGFQPLDGATATTVRKAVGGNAEVSGSFEGFLDDTNIFAEADMINQEAAAATITLNYNRINATGDSNTIQQVSFNGWLTGFATGVRPGEPNSVAGTFVGTGAPAWVKNTAE